MGNVCSSGKKKNKDNISERSEESPSYQLSSKRNSKANKDLINDKLAPLADPEQTDLTNQPRNGTAGKTQIPKAGDSVSSTPQAVTAPEELTCKTTLPQNLIPLQGRPKSSRRTEKDKKIIIYVLSSGFEHNLEKAVLAELYGVLKDRCDCRGFELIFSDNHSQFDSAEDRHQILDILQWTDSPLEAQGGHEEAANCLADVVRHTNASYVVPILFLGTSLGRPLLPLTIESQDFSTVYSSANENLQTLLNKWYKLDDTSQPNCHRLVTNHSSEFNDDLQILLEGLIEVFPRELKDSYLTTIVEQEINNTVLISQELAKRCMWIQTGNVPVKVPENVGVVEIENCHRLMNLHTELRNQLPEKNLIRIPPTIQVKDDQLSSIMESILKSIIDGIFDEHAQKYSIPSCTYGVNKRLLSEIETTGQYAKMLGQNCANFAILEDIKRYVMEDSSAPLIILGSKGSGKSVLTSKIMNYIHVWSPDFNLILRYSHLTEMSASITSLMGSIADQLSILLKGSISECKHAIGDYSKFLNSTISEVKTPLLIVIDSYDDLNGSNAISWIPDTLPSNVKIILTISPNSDLEENETLTNLKKQSVPNENFISLIKFSKEQWEEILGYGGGDFYAANGALQLPQSWKQCSEKTPIQAKILWWLAWQGVKHLENTQLKTIIDKFFETIEGRFTKPEYVRFFLTLLSVSIMGIKEIDCINLFKLKMKHLDYTTAFRIWSKFSWHMGPMLVHMNQISLMDRILRMEIQKKYKSQENEMHSLIVDYFTGQKNFFADKHEKHKSYNEQKFLKLPYHAYMLNTELSEIQSLLNSKYYTDLQWYHDKIMATGCVQILSDIRLIENKLKTINEEQLSSSSSMPSSSNLLSNLHIQLIKDFVLDNYKELNCAGEQFYPLLKAYLHKCEKQNDQLMDDNEIIKNWKTFLSGLNETYLEQLNQVALETTATNDAEVAMGDGQGKSSRNFDVVSNLSGCGDCFVAAISTTNGEITVWNAASCEKVRTLTGVTMPISMCSVENYEAAVLCRREIKVINLDDGFYKVTLKGVMNQKMPYFGLHDSKHLVCLSRNRMYVNLMNLESGDCVTTFKAGEDRFLNSLLVSGDGRILVCGDETQKPFPLLVWHLSQRKLLYDLRIPHHDFITSLSAITHEGSYVCVVAKELNEPTPNFIVVYDLQSGTLFKKWKPSCNTVSLAISQGNACVIAGLEDARIVIWDLVTGNCKYTLSGHNAPVTLLKLDPLGKVLLSGDTECRDMCIRMWELNTGKPLAVYTSPRKIVSCEILPNGRYVVLALENSTDLLSLVLRNHPDGNSLEEDKVQVYGKIENNGKVSNLSAE